MIDDEAVFYILDLDSDETLVVACYRSRIGHSLVNELSQKVAEKKYRNQHVSSRSHLAGFLRVALGLVE